MAWNFHRADYSIEQLARAVPAAMREWGRAKASREHRPLAKSDLKLPYKNKDGSVNCEGVEAALRMIGHVKGAPPDVIRRAQKELERHRCRKAGAAIVGPLDELVESLKRRGVRVELPRGR